METSDERREVAENLRYLTIGRHISYKEQFFDELAETVVGIDDYHDFDTVIEKLADLIDPTCKLVEVWDEGRGEHFLDCTACHFFERLDGAPDDDPDLFNARRLWADVDWAALHRCPFCGARVVSGDGY